MAPIINVCTGIPCDEVTAQRCTLHRKQLHHCSWKKVFNNLMLGVLGVCGRIVSFLKNIWKKRIHRVRSNLWNDESISSSLLRHINSYKCSKISLIIYQELMIYVCKYLVHIRTAYRIQHFAQIKMTASPRKSCTNEV